ncbi:MAG TPA: imelysin family protein [Puia sp.]|jgi:predicted lipoprotein|nr:imelysin family protein [Puia sp.]
MNRLVLSSIALYCLAITACSKSSDSGNSTQTFAQTESDVINQFVSKTALPQYDNLVTAGTSLDANIQILKTTTTDANLQTAQTSWRTMRQVWERCEGFLIGPVESNDYDPNSDTWPTDYKQMDSLLASNNPLEFADIQNLPQTLRGYHPIEYLIFGEGGSRRASELDARKMKYLTSLSLDLKGTVTDLYNDWTGGSVNYAVQITNISSSNPVYPTRQSFFLDIAGDNGMAGICNEVGQPNEDGKMYNPYIKPDSTLAESPYSGNSLTDFKNNIIGAQQVYLGLNGGKGVKDLVAAKNKDLDNKIQAAFTSAISSFDNISGSDNMRFEVAIYKRRTQVATTMTQLNTLQALLENDLLNFIKTYVKD